MRTRQRRSFAAPFVFTLVAGCTGSPKTVEPPRPDPEGEPYQTWSVRGSGGEQCDAYLEIECPPPEQGMTCNPPPPAVVACPGGLADGESVTIVQLEEDGPCYAQADECPEGGCDREPAECPSWD